MKFSVLNADFNDPSLDFLGSRKTAHEGTKERYRRKSHNEMAVEFANRNCYRLSCVS